MIRDPRSSNNVPTQPDPARTLLSTNELVFDASNTRERKWREWKNDLNNYRVTRSVCTIFSAILRNRKNFFKESPRFVCIPFLNNTYTSLYRGFACIASWSNNLKDRFLESHVRAININCCAWLDTRTEKHIWIGKHVSRVFSNRT